jgi:hypothetical protein
MNVEKSIYRGLAPLFFSKQARKKPGGFSETFLEEFKKNYIKEQCKSLVVRSVFCISGGIALGCLISQGLTSTATLTSIVVSGTFGYNWNNWATTPYNLALCAYKAMSSRCEKAALEAIKDGANVYQDFSHLSLKGGINLNLFSQASAFDCQEVVKCLTSLGWDLNKDASVLGRAPSLAMAQLLVELGADVNLYDGIKFSPLWIQLSSLFNLKIKDQTPSDSELLDEYEKKCQIILFLIEQGAKLQSKPPRFDEKQRFKNNLQQFLSKIDHLKDERTEKLKNGIINISCKI